MTKIEELEQKLNECQKALAELKESKKEGKWKPKIDEEYYFRSVEGGISSASFTSDLDELRYRNTLLFPTYEECLRYCRFMDTVKEKSYELSRDDFENDNFSKYMIAYNFVLKNFYVDCVLNRKYFGEIYFKSKEDAQYIIDNFKDELMEYFV